ncbi:MAG: HIT domain-containing protein [Zoogloea sp.]|nr:HIT domain-containing protein [Zoogloea sp.]
MNETACPFSQVPAERIVLSGAEAWLIRDTFPLSPSHSLAIPRRHVGSFFELSAAEHACMVEPLAQAKAGLDESCRPDGFNIGISDGTAAGQTVPHLHLHLIPRYAGDAPAPHGGVRWVPPARAKYLAG